MTDYISREEIIEFGDIMLKRLDDGEAYRRLNAWLEVVPAADVRPVILCDECEFWTKSEKSLQGRCALLCIYPTATWYCANAKRRESA